MAEFAQVQSIQTVAGDDGKGILQLKIAGATEPLTVTCASLDTAEDMADLIDGYCRLVHDMAKTLWSRKGELQENVWTCHVAVVFFFLAFFFFFFFFLCACTCIALRYLDLTWRSGLPSQSTLVSCLFFGKLVLS